MVKNASYTKNAPTERGGRIFQTAADRAEWLALRSRGIGGSEIGTVLGVNPWKSATQLFFEKLGLFQDEESNNMRMFMGNFMEAHIADLWQHWDGSEESIVANYRAGRKVRQCSERPETMWLKKHPFLIANIDRQIDKAPGRKGRGVLECKTINGYYAQQWAAGVPPSYLYQIQQYMFVTGFKYSELALLQDGNAMSVLEFEADPNAQELILEKGSEFWQRIQAARPAAVKYLTEEGKQNPDRNALSDYMEEVEEYEPAPESMPAYEEFLRKRYKQAYGTSIADPEDVRMAKQYAEFNRMKKDIEERRQEVANAIMRRIGESEILDMGDAGKVTWKVNERGTRVLRVTVKE